MKERRSFLPLNLTEQKATIVYFFYYYFCSSLLQYTFVYVSNYKKNFNEFVFELGYYRSS